MRGHLGARSQRAVLSYIEISVTKQLAFSRRPFWGLETLVRFYPGRSEMLGDPERRHSPFVAIFSCKNHLTALITFLGALGGRV